MRIQPGFSIILIAFLTSCAVIPKETVTLSQTMGNDLATLRQAHINLAELNFRKIKADINSFVDGTYAPFIIHYALSKQLQAYKAGQPSLYSSIEAAGKDGGEQEAAQALKIMTDFQIGARKQIEKKRNELLSPVEKQENEIISAINQSYENVIYANSTVTGYLQSIRKVKEAQQDALSKIGLKGADSIVTRGLVNISERVNEVVEKGKEIDVMSADAINQLDAITKAIQEITLKK